MNILLLGFKESRDVTAMELFYHEMVKRGFKPSSSSYGIRIDAYCKKGYFADALRIFEEMERANCLPTLETVTTLIHGAGVARNAMKARELFDEIPKRNLQADTGAYNALISSLVKCREVKSAIQLMDEMEKNNIHYDDMTYHTMFLGLMKSGSIEGVCELYHKMIDRNFVPKTRTVVMLMKFFCVNSQIDLGLNLWGYLVGKGYCPHHHALDLLVTGLCSRGRSHEAFKCSKQSLERGIHVSEAVYGMLERFLLQSNMTDKLGELNQMIEKLQSVLPPSSGNYIHSPSNGME
jgi:pentatricopeptide repeat protein